MRATMLPKVNNAIAGWRVVSCFAVMPYVVSVAWPAACILVVAMKRSLTALVLLMLICFAIPGLASPWRRTTRGWERAYWLEAPVSNHSGSLPVEPTVPVERSEPVERSAKFVWQKLHPSVIAALQFGTSYLFLLTFHTSPPQRRLRSRH